jgi:hypothetical protein
MTHYNAQSPTSTRKYFGMGQPYIDQWAADGLTPTTRAPYCNNFSFNYTSNQDDEMNGSPAMIQDVYNIGEGYEVTFNFNEDDYEIWCSAAATGLCNSTKEVVSAGGLIETNKQKILFVHYFYNGERREWYLWRCVGTGVVPVKYEMGDGATKNTYDVSYKGLVQTGLIDWAGTPLARGEYLFKSQIEAAA